MHSGGTGRFSPSTYLMDLHPGVQVIEMDLPGNVQGCVDHEQRIIWIARGLTEAEHRSTLAYEIGQLLQGPTSDNPIMAAAQRRAAEDWAALMLIPSDLFAAAWGCCRDLPSMAMLCGVDLQTFRARIRAATDADQDAAMEFIADRRMSA